MSLLSAERSGVAEQAARSVFRVFRGLGSRGLGFGGLGFRGLGFRGLGVWGLGFRGLGMGPESPLASTL